MNVKMNFLNSHLDQFPSNLSDEQGGEIPSRYQNYGGMGARPLGLPHDGGRLSLASVWSTSTRPSDA